MADVLPLLLLPAVIGWWVAERRQRTARRDLRQAIAVGNAPMLADAGIAPVVVVARSLGVAEGRPCRPCPWWIVGRRRSAWDVEQLVAPLALTLTEVIGVERDRLGRPAGFTGASRFSGHRHGRDVRVELGVSHGAISLAAPSAMPSFVVSACVDGRLQASGAVPVAVEAALETLAPSRHWRGVVIEVDGADVQLARATAPASSWLHDLWIAEFVADLAAPASAPRRRSEADGSEPGSGLISAPVGA